MTMFQTCAGVGHFDKLTTMFQIVWNHQPVEILIYDVMRQRVGFRFWDFEVEACKDAVDKQMRLEGMSESLAMFEERIPR